MYINTTVTSILITTLAKVAILRNLLNANEMVHGFSYTAVIMSNPNTVSRVCRYGLVTEKHIHILNGSHFFLLLYSSALKITTTQTASF
jgi:hypothetical protein